MKASLVSKKHLLTLIATSTLIATQANAADIRWAASAASVSVDTPEVQASFNGPGTPQGEAGGTLKGTAVSITGAIALNNGLNVGTEPRLEITASWLGADDNTSEPSASGAFGMMPVDGSGNSDGGGPVSTLYFDTELQDIGVDIMLREKMNSRGALSWSLFGGLALSQTRVEHEFSGSGNLPIVLQDEITTSYYGLGGGVDASYAITPKLFITTGARLDLLAAKSEMDADQLIFTAYTASDSDSAFAGRLGAHAGIIYKAGSLAIGANLSASYRSYAPTVVHPTNEFNPTPSTLDDDSVTGYGINLSTGLTF